MRVFVFNEVVLSIALVTLLAIGFRLLLHTLPPMQVDKPINHPPNSCITRDAFSGTYIPCHIGWRTWETWIKDGKYC